MTDKKNRKSPAKAPTRGMECRLILVRHSTCEGMGRFQGHSDVPLTGAGRKQIAGLARKLGPYPIRAIYSSDLLRARQTADPVARKFGLQVDTRLGLREMDFGSWQGLSWRQVRRRFPKDASTWVKRFPYHAIPGAERFNDFKMRVEREMNRIVRANKRRCVLVVTHAGVVRIILAGALGIPSRNLFRIAQDPCGINVIDYFRDQAVVGCMNG